MKKFRIYFIKSISYRIVSIITTFLISYALTGNATLAGSIASIDAVIKFALYFFHEQAWGHVLKKYKKKRKQKLLEEANNNMA